MPYKPVEFDKRGMRRQRDREQKIIGMASDGMTLVDIGKVFGVTRERIRQIIARCRGENSLVVAPHVVRKLHFVALSVIVRHIGGTSQIQHWIDKGVIHPVRRGQHLYITREELGRAKEQWEQIRPKCRVCGNNMAGSGRNICRRCLWTPEANKINNILCKERRLSGQIKNRFGIQAKIANELRRDGDCRIGLFEARDISGLTTMQITYARQCGTISSVKTGRRAGLGEEHLYSSSEMRDIACLIEEMRIPETAEV